MTPVWPNLETHNPACRPRDRNLRTPQRHGPWPVFGTGQLRKTLKICDRHRKLVPVAVRRTAVRCRRFRRQTVARLGGTPWWAQGGSDIRLSVPIISRSLENARPVQRASALGEGFREGETLLGTTLHTCHDFTALASSPQGTLRLDACGSGFSESASLQISLV